MMCHRVRLLRCLALPLGVLACGPLKVMGPPGDAATSSDGGSVPGQGPPGYGVGEPGDGGLPPGLPAPRPPSMGEQCAEEAIRGEVVPLDLLLVLDASGSMNTAVGERTDAGARPTRWQLVSEALARFVRDPRSAGLGVGVQTFPFIVHEKACSSIADCGGPDAEADQACSRPFLCVDDGTLPATAATCDPNVGCVDGKRCVPSGRCSASSMRCVNLGQPCPGGGPADLCAEAPLLCTLPIDSCQVADYERPKIPIGVLPAAMPAVTQGLSAVRPAGNTPIAAALDGVTRYLRRHLAERSDRRAALVLATDALPNGCQNDAIEAVGAVLAAARAGTPPVATYVIGAISPGDMVQSDNANRLAQAGGTAMPFLLNDSTPDLGSRFLDALNAIRGSALPCELRIPQPSTGMIDFQKVNVRFTAAAGPVDLVYVGSADRCDPVRGGWHYDVDPTRGIPTTVRVCAATCRRFAAEAGGTVELRFGCRTRID
jgi:hypothetical protein